MTAIDTAVLVSTDDPIMTIIIIFVPIHQNKNNPRYYQLICSPIYDITFGSCIYIENKLYTKFNLYFIFLLP